MSDSANQQVITALANALKSSIPEWYGQGATMQEGSAALLTYPYSFFVRYPILTSSGEQTLLAKIHRKPYMATLSDALAADWLRPVARDEYEMTKSIWSAFEGDNSSGCAAVQPLGLMGEWNAILMRRVEGKPLKNYLMSASVVLRLPSMLVELKKYLGFSTRWLRIFHDRISGAQVVPFPVNDALDLLNEILEKLSRQSKGQVDVEAYRSALLKQLDGISAVSVPVGLLHDDFQYSNILIQTDGQACVLDYALNYRGCVYSDLATFMVDPQTREFQILSGGRFVSAGFIRAFNQTILDVYFAGMPYHKDVLNFYCALAALNKWSADEAELFNSWRKSLFLVFSRVTRRYYAGLLIQYL